MRGCGQSIKLHACSLALFSCLEFALTMYEDSILKPKQVLCIESRECLFKEGCDVCFTSEIDEMASP